MLQKDKLKSFNNDYLLSKVATPLKLRPNYRIDYLDDENEIASELKTSLKQYANLAEKKFQSSP